MATVAYRATAFPAAMQSTRYCSTASCSFLARLYIPNPALVRTIFALGVAYILVTGPWLIYDGRHWLIDVLGGYSYGAFYLLALTLPPTTGSSTVVPARALTTVIPASERESRGAGTGMDARLRGQ